MTMIKMNWFKYHSFRWQVNFAPKFWCLPHYSKDLEDSYGPEFTCYINTFCIGPFQSQWYSG